MQCVDFVHCVELCGACMPAWVQCADAAGIHNAGRCIILGLVRDDGLGQVGPSCCSHLAGLCPLLLPAVDCRHQSFSRIL